MWNSLGEGPSENSEPRSCQLSSSDSTTSKGTDIDTISTNKTLNPIELNTIQNHTDIKNKFLPLPKLKPFDIKPVDQLFAILNRFKDTGDITMMPDELDHIQWTLEKMLSSTIVLKNTAKDTLKSFSAILSTSQCESEEVICPIEKESVAAKTPFINVCYKGMDVSDSSNKEKSPAMEEKSENKFWSFIDTYMSPITKTDIDWLENRIKSYDIDDLTEIPPLGEHYSNTLAKKELEMEKYQSSCSTTQTPEKSKLSKRVMPDVVDLLNTVQKGSVYTPVYSNVTSVLLEHLQTSSDDFENDYKDTDDSDTSRETSSETHSQEMGAAAKELFVEQNIEEKFYNLDLLNSNANNEKLPSSFPESDEILREIENCDFVLSELRKQNKKDLTTILEKCNIDYNQQNISAKLKELDEKILEYKRQPNDHLTNEEKKAQIQEENFNMQLLLHQRTDYVMQLKSNKPILNDSELGNK